MQYTDRQLYRLTDAERERHRQIDAYLRDRRRARKRRKRLVAITSMLLVVIIACLTPLLVMLYKDFKNGDTAPDTNNKTTQVATIPASTKPDEQKEEKDKSSNKSSDFSSIYYYEADKQDRYETYSKLHPEYSKEDVVWMVNAHLDKPFYGYDVSTDGYDDPFIIVNKYYTVPEGYNPPDLVNADGVYLRAETAQAYQQMKSAAASAGMRILAVSGYRSVDYQRGLYNSYLANDSQASVDRYSARAGHSEHHTGMAIDLFGSIDGLRNFEFTPEYQWLLNNGYKHGFIIRYPSEEAEKITGYEKEPWHIRYVGTEVSTDMRNKGIETFEEYHVKYIAHKSNN